MSEHLENCAVNDRNPDGIEKPCDCAPYRSLAFAPCSTVFYFGCIDRSGHYLWHPTQGEVRRMDRVQPWGNQIDGGVAGGSKDRETLGVVHSAKLKGWTLVTWADRSVDSRHGSHSTFIVEADISPERLIELAREQWPKVFSRPGFPSLSNAGGMARELAAQDSESPTKQNG